MSNVMATTARNRYGHLIYVAGSLLLGFSMGVDVTRRFPREASWFGSPAFYIALPHEGAWLEPTVIAVLQVRCAAAGEIPWNSGSA
jgi:hypothetical protein